MFGTTQQKIIVKQMLLEEDLAILCLQETELEANLDHNLLSTPGYAYELELGFMSKPP